MIGISNRIVVAIRKHIAANKPLPSAHVIICADESSDRGIIVPALEVVEPRLRVVVVPSVPQRVDVSDEGGLLHDRAGRVHHRRNAPRVIAVPCDNRAARVQQPNHVALHVQQVVIQRRRRCRAGLVDQCIRLVAVVVQEVQRFAAPCLLHHKTAQRGEFILRGADRLAAAHAGHVVSIRVTVPGVNVRRKTISF